MKEKRIRCPYCRYTVPKNHWKSKKEISPGVYEIIWWCERCQKDFTARAQKTNVSYTIDGYVMVKIPSIGWIKEHKFVWELAHGKLPAGYVIHHINGNKTDNSIENLVAIPKHSHSTRPPDANTRVISDLNKRIVELEAKIKELTN